MVKIYALIARRPQSVLKFAIQTIALPRRFPFHRNSKWTPEMIVEMREYALVPGQLAPFLELYESKGWSVQRAHLGHCLGFYTTEFGDVNGVVHMWRYGDMAERTARRADLMRDARWLAFLNEVAPCLKHMENRLLTPAPFATPNPVTPIA